MLREQLHRVRMRAIWSWQGFRHVWQTEGSLSQWIIAEATLAMTVLQGRVVARTRCPSPSLTLRVGVGR